MMAMGKTNKEIIRSMTDEQLEKFLDKLLRTKRKCMFCTVEDWKTCKGPCSPTIVRDWLNRDDEQMRTERQKKRLEQLKNL